MRMKRVFCILLAGAMSVSCFCMRAGATGEVDNYKDAAFVMQRASGRFNMDVSAKKIAKASSSFPMEAGETVKINAVYSPDTASVDFGLLDSKGVFHYVNVTSGNINQTIEIEESGNYTLAVRNNSEKTVKVSGFVNY